MSEPSSPPESDPLKEFAELVGASEGVPAAKVKSLKAVVGTLMWLAYLPAEEQDQFWWELYVALDRVHGEDADATGVDYAKGAGPILHAWKATAQAHADGVPFSSRSGG